MKTQNEKSNARSEAAIYAEGTPYIQEELYAIWLSDEENPENDPPQYVYEKYLRSDHRFTEDWLY